MCQTDLDLVPGLLIARREVSFCARSFIFMNLSFLIHKVGRVTSLYPWDCFKDSIILVKLIAHATAQYHPRPCSLLLSPEVWYVAASLTSGCLPQLPLCQSASGCSDLDSRLSMLPVLRLATFKSRSTVPLGWTHITFVCRQFGVTF